MNSPAITLVSVLAWLLLSGLGGAVAEPGSVLGFGYCPPPVIPSCIERSARTRSRRDIDGCNRDVLRFTQTLGTYRTCLTRESERAIGTGNDAIARFRCLAQHGRTCRPGTDGISATER
ncbi:hypothetical protein [Lichenifustis flavocetrariae]|uniref:Uncharacterized protein n=1 Tax=Lichenifustis flavocetrariae TaxID=2949735 RepID=A0AA41ZAT8_9HYPH|nr:hypothetical protein [Lichenifustis flavocetrariae]MCW6512477.1 hypothetical protein [Lichenifustis flavocetrariae]